MMGILRVPTAPPRIDPSPAAREAVRARKLGKVPRWYSPFGHLAATTGISLGICVLALLRVHGLRPAELFVVPLAAFLANLLEWRAHKYLLHRRFRPLEILYYRHTPEHHAIYVTNDMAIRDVREFRLVLIPAVGVAAIVIATMPVAFLVAACFGANAGWLFLATAAFEMASYELLHLSYHLSPDSFIGRRWLVGVLRRHHARHHDPRLMQKWNFNVTFPFCDWLFGTTYRGAVDS